MGVRVGMVFTIGSLACLTGAPIAGALIDFDTGKYEYAQIFGGTTVIVGTLTLLAARLAQLRGSNAPSWGHGSWDAHVFNPAQRSFKAY